MAKVFDKITVDAKLIDQMIEIIGKRSADLKRDIQTTVICASLRAAMTRDITRMQKLDDALGDGWYRSTLRAWAVKNGPFGYRLKETTNAEGKVLPVGFTFDKDKAAALKAEYEAGDAKCIARLTALPWETAKAEKMFDGFDLLEVIKRGTSKAEKVLADDTKATHAKTKIDPDLLAKIKALIAEHELAREVNGGNNTPAVVDNSATVSVH